MTEERKMTRRDFIICGLGVLGLSYLIVRGLQKFDEIGDFPMLPTETPDHSRFPELETIKGTIFESPSILALPIKGKDIGVAFFYARGNDVLPLLAPAEIEGKRGDIGGGKILTLYDLITPEKGVFTEDISKVNGIDPRISNPHLFHIDSVMKPNGVRVFSNNASDSFPFQALIEGPLSKVFPQVAELLSLPGVRKDGKILAHSGYIFPDHVENLSLSSVTDKDLATNGLFALKTSSGGVAVLSYLAPNKI